MHLFAWIFVLAFGYVFISLGVRMWRLPRQKRVRYLLRQLALLTTFYLGLMLMLMWLERRLVFHPSPFPVAWQAPSGMNLQEIELKTSDGNRLHAFWCPVPGARWTLLYNHGNAGHIAGRVDLVRNWQHQLGASVLIYDYPGFGRSTGVPDEKSCYAAAQAAYDWLRTEQKVPPEQLLLYGKSLGCAMATEMALRNPHRALLLMSGFTSIPDMAQEMFPFFPARWMARTHFDNAAKLSQYRGVLLLAHGTDDPVIPYHHGLRLDAVAARTRWKSFLTVDGWGHFAPPESYYQAAANMLKTTPHEAITPVEPLP